MTSTHDYESIVDSDGYTLDWCRVCGVLRWCYSDGIAITYQAPKAVADVPDFVTTEPPCKGSQPT